MDYSFLNEILILLTAAVAVVVLFLRLNLPSILGYLTVGILMGPYGMGLISDAEHTHVLAEFGVVFLLFTIGLEFSLPLLIRMKGAVLGIGGSQVLLSTIITTVTAMVIGLPLETAIVLGGIVTMSSTALVTKQLTEQVELHTRHGRNAVGVLLFQDIMVIPFLIYVAGLSSTVDTSALSIITAMVKGLLALVVILAIGHWALRPLFRVIAKHRSTELFTLTALLVTLAAAWSTQQMGMSLALGAFIAGMMMGETEFRHQLEAEIRPFRDILLGLFFITIGMLLNVKLLPEVWFWVLLLLAALVLFKLILVTIICKIAGWDNAVSWRTGMVLAHGGEFGFAILALALSANVLENDYGQVVLAALIISMAFAPILIRYNKRLIDILIPEATKQSARVIKDEIIEIAHDLSDHIIICGYGRVGQNIARFIEEENIDYIAMDTDPILVQNAIKAKEPVSYGDSANLELIKAAGLDNAAALVISLNNTDTSLKIISRVRELNTKIPILVRTPDDSMLEKLLSAGATEVVPETMEASLTLSSHLLLALDIPVARVAQMMRKIRQERYALLHHLFPGEESMSAILDDHMEQLRAIDIEEGTWAINHRIDDLGLQEINIEITAIERGDDHIIDPSPHEVITPRDTLVLFGSPSHLDEAEVILSQLKSKS